MELRKIDFEKERSFVCEGRTFYLNESLSFARYKEFQKLNLEFGFSGSFIDIYTELRKLHDVLNAAKFVDSAVMLHNILYGVVAVEDKYDPALRLCALYINEEGEDLTVYDEGKMREKINCWAKTLDSTPFFQLAANLVSGWMNAYAEITRSGLKAEEKEKENQV